MNEKSKQPIVFAALLLLVLVGAGVWVGYALSRRVSPQTRYSAVYLTSGDIYFGELKWFPKPHLKNPWYLDRSISAGENQPQLAVSLFRNVFWSPGENIYFSPKQIVWVAPIRPESDFARALEESKNISSGDGFQGPQSSLPAVTPEE